MTADRKKPTEESLASAEDLTSEEERRAQEHSSVNAVVVHEAVYREGAEQLLRPSSSLAFSGTAAGLSMGFSMVGVGLLDAHLPDASWRVLISSFGYALGFLIVVLGRHQLFTEDTLTVVLPLLDHRDIGTFMNVLRLWGVVLVSNLVAAFVFAWTVGNTDVFTPEVKEAFATIGQEAMVGDFGTILLRGVFAGWLIALMVWLLPFAGVEKFFIIIVLAYVVKLGGFAHIIAGSVEVLYLVTAGVASWGEYFGDFMIPTLIGNIIGGVVLVAGLNHAQVLFRAHRSGSSERQAE